MFHVRNLPRNESDMDNITLRFVSCSNNFLLIYQRGTVYTADAGLFLPRCSIACLHLQTVWLGLEFARTQLMIDTGTLFNYNSNKNCFEFDSFISPADNECERIFLTLQFFSNVQFRHCLVLFLVFRKFEIFSHF